MQSVSLIRIFIASPGDVQKERIEACGVIQEWECCQLYEAFHFD